MLSVLYLIFIKPIEILIEILYTLLYYLLQDAGAVIPFVSLLVFLLTLPLYRRADKLQEEEHVRAGRMEDTITHIKKTFRGSERAMMLNTCYRQYGYSPLQVFRGSLPLLLQVPFFIAAYVFLSDLSLLPGTPFLWIRDLGAPDRTLSFGAFRVNLLPVLMTLFNILAGMVYTRGRPLQDKLQSHALALLFLLLLYHAPSGLVLYWTCNQILSLGKYLVSAVLKSRREKKEEGIVLSETKAQEPKKNRTISAAFLCGAFLLAILTGLLIPSALIADSPQEFINVHAFYHPLRHLASTFAVSCGTFLFWGYVLYFTGTARGKKRLTLVFAVLSFHALLNYLFFGRYLGVISATLILDEAPHFSGMLLAGNLLALIGAGTLIILLFQKKPGWCAFLSCVCALAALFLSVSNLRTITRETKSVRESTLVLSGAADETEEITPIVTLSRSKPNVVFIMLDRAIGGYIPYIMQEKPELREQFSGFTYYDNTLSHGAYTIFGAPELFGGYDYTPDAMNARSSESLVQKHNEALRVLPALFSEEGFDVTVCDPPYANYRWIPDLSIYKDLPEVKAYLTDGAYTDTLDKDFAQRDHAVFERDLFLYALMKSSPLFLQNAIYDGGSYLSLAGEQSHEKLFLNAYAVLANLDALCDIRDDAPAQLVMLQNATTHEPVLLQLPSYEPSPVVRNAGLEDPARFTLADGRSVRMESNWQLSHYHVNMAALTRIGNWLTGLKEAGVYDNTRIIIASDHGRNLGQFPELLLSDGFDAEYVNALLLFKDFSADAPFAVSHDFMTVADAPSLALQGIVTEPLNPFTGNAITMLPKEEPQLVTTSEHWRPSYHKGNVFDFADAKWYAVEGDIWVKENWVLVEEEKE